MAITDAMKDKARYVIEKYYSEGYITANEMKAFVGSLDLDAMYDYSLSRITIQINADGREILFSSGLLFYLTVFDSQGYVDFTVNYNYINDQFWTTEYDTFYVNKLTQ